VFATSDDGAVQFASPASTSLDELVQLRGSAQSLLRRARKKSGAPLAGAAVSRRLGRGLDFAEVREYQPGDDVRMIDWNVTARTDRTHTKLFVEERETPVLLVVDFRADMRFGTRGMYKSMLAARLAALLGWCSVANRDRVGGFVFTDDWHSEVRPQAGRRGLMRLFRTIAQGQMHVPGENKGQFADSLARLRHVAQAGSTVILLSDFKGFDKHVRTALGGLLHNLDFVAVQIVDPLEMALPQAGRYSLNAMRNNERMSIEVGSRKQAREYADRFLSHRQVVDDFFKRGRHLHLLANTSQPLLDTALRVLMRSPDRVEVADSDAPAVKSTVGRS